MSVKYPRLSDDEQKAVDGEPPHGDAEAVVQMLAAALNTEREARARLEAMRAEIIRRIEDLPQQPAYLAVQLGTIRFLCTDEALAAIPMEFLK